MEPTPEASPIEFARPLGSFELRRGDVVLMGADIGGCKPRRILTIERTMVRRTTVEKTSGNTP